jgi:hypothetical protein
VVVVVVEVVEGGRVGWVGEWADGVGGQTGWGSYYFKYSNKKPF